MVIEKKALILEWTLRKQLDYFNVQVQQIKRFSNFMKTEKTEIIS